MLIGFPLVVLFMVRPEGPTRAGGERMNTLRAGARKAVCPVGTAEAGSVGKKQAGCALVRRRITNGHN